MSCNICLTKFSSGNELYWTSCGHMFHCQCLQTWSHSHTDCPLCRTPEITRTFLTFTSTEGSDDATELVRLRGRQPADYAEQERLRRQIIVPEEEEALTANQHQLEQENAKLKREKEQAEKQCERHGKENEQLRYYIRNLQATYQSFYQKPNRNAWGRNQISIRNYPATVASDPKMEIMALMARLSMAVDPNDVVIKACTELVAQKPLFQIFVEFKDTHSKLELIAKFPQLSDHEIVTLHRLELRDAIDTAALCKQAYRKLQGGRGGVCEIRNRDNQVIIKLFGDTELIEIASEEQIEAISIYLNEIPLDTRRAKRLRQRAKREQNTPTIENVKQQGQLELQK